MKNYCDSYRITIFNFFDFSVDYLEDVLCHEFASLALSSMAGKLINYRMMLLSISYCLEDVEILVRKYFRLCMTEL